MAEFVFAYHGGTSPSDPAEVEKTMARWGAWFEEMGAAVVDGGAPVGMSKTVSGSGVADDGGSNPLSGYSIVSADSIEAACEMAKGCPMVQDGEGTVEVVEKMKM